MLSCVETKRCILFLSAFRRNWLEGFWIFTFDPLWTFEKDKFSISILGQLLQTLVLIDILSLFFQQFFKLIQPEILYSLITNMSITHLQLVLSQKVDQRSNSIFIAINLFSISVPKSLNLLGTELLLVDLLFFGCH